MILLFISELLGLLVNTLNANDNSFLRNSENLRQPIQMKLSKKQKTFYVFLLRFCNLNQILNILKKKITHINMNIKIINMLKGPKHCWNLNGATFIIFSHHCKANRVGKCLSWWYLKSLHCSLTYWLPITSIFLVIGRIYRNQLKFNYLRNKKLLLNFLLYFWFYIKFLKSWKKDDSYNWSIFEVTDVVRKMSKKSRFRADFPVSKSCLTVNIPKGPKHCWNCHALREIELENVSVSDIWNLSRVC